MSKIAVRILFLACCLGSAVATAAEEARRSPVWFVRGTICSLEANSADETIAQLAELKATGANALCLPPTFTADDLPRLVKAAHGEKLHVLLRLAESTNAVDAVVSSVSNLVEQTMVDGFFCPVRDTAAVAAWEGVRKATMKRHPDLVLVAVGDCPPVAFRFFDARFNHTGDASPHVVRTRVENNMRNNPVGALEINKAGCEECLRALAYCLPGVPLIGLKEGALPKLAEMRRINPAFDAPCAPVKWLEHGDAERIIAFERTDKRGNGFRFVGNLSAPLDYTITELKAPERKRGSDPSETRIKLEVVSSDSLNLLQGENWDLLDGYKGWYGPPNYHRGVTPRDVLVPGKAYVVSCLIRPHAKDARVGFKNIGTGLSMTSWSKDWKKAEGISAMGCSLGEWKRVYSEPWTMPEWGCNPGIFLQGNPEPDMVRDIRITPADCELRVTASAPQPIRQVRVLDANGAVVFDTGVMSGEKVFARAFLVPARGRYRVLAVAADGDLAWRDIGESEEGGSGE